MRREVVNMSDINPYDGTHFENPSDWEPDDYQKHREGIEFIKKEILKGRSTYPIAIREAKLIYGGVNKELGDTMIICFIYDDSDGDIVTPGMQEGKGFY
jgi:hypothetical protein